MVLLVLVLLLLLPMLAVDVHVNVVGGGVAIVVQSCRCSPIKANGSVVNFVVVSFVKYRVLLDGQT